MPETAEQWMEGAVRNEGSWWPHWQARLADGGEAEKVPARQPGGGELAVIEAAPGSYARKRD